MMAIPSSSASFRTALISCSLWPKMMNCQFSIGKLDLYWRLYSLMRRMLPMTLSKFPRTRYFWEVSGLAPSMEHVMLAKAIFYERLQHFFADEIEIGAVVRMGHDLPLEGEAQNVSQPRIEKHY